MMESNQITEARNFRHKFMEKHLERVSRRRFNRWLKDKRKTYVKYFKHWAPWSEAYLYEPIRMIIEDMAQYYGRGDNVTDTHFSVDADGNIVAEDDRFETLWDVVLTLNAYEYLMQGVDSPQVWDEAQGLLKEAFVAIAENMYKWWD